MNLAVIDCNGVGYAVNTTTNTLSRLKLNDRAKLYISECIKEDSFDLYGFATLSEKRCFEMLLGVSGIGPKAAQAILCAATPEGLALAIMNGDDKAITAAQGVGKKIAQRVILELKDKVSQEMGGYCCAHGARLRYRGDKRSAQGLGHWHNGNRADSKSGAKKPYVREQ